MEAFQDFEEKITCPYDNAHFIRKSKMGVHIVKCAKNFPDAEIVICDFNATHRIPKPELRYHHETCPDRRLIETQIIQQENEDPSAVYPIHNVKIPVEDDWDNDNHGGYNPLEYCEQNNVLRHVDVESSSIRRNFRLEERERLNQFKTADTSKKIDSDDSKVKTAQEAMMERLISSGQASGFQDVDEEAPHLSLIQRRIKKGQKKTYEAI